jgi:hypothetical protein
VTEFGAGRGSDTEGAGARTPCPTSSAAYAPGLVRRVAGWLGGKLQDWGYTLALWKWSKRPTSDDV